jgi:hypothetical protein
MESTKQQELTYLGHVIWATVITLLVLSYVTVSLRIFVRYRITKTPGFDDVAMIVTLVSYSTTSVAISD